MHSLNTSTSQLRSCSSSQFELSQVSGVAACSLWSILSDHSWDWSSYLHGWVVDESHVYLDLQSGTFTGSGAGLPTPAFFWIWSGAFSKSLYVDSQGFAFFVVCISSKVNPLLMQ